MAGETVTLASMVEAHAKSQWHWRLKREYASIGDLLRRLDPDDAECVRRLEKIILDHHAPYDGIDDIPSCARAILRALVAGEVGS